MSAEENAWPSDIDVSACEVCDRENCEDHLPADAHSAEADSFPATWKLLDDVELLALPDPEFLIDGVLQRRGVGVLYAPSGVGKTTLIAGIATAVATGRPWFGHAVRHPGASVYVATEDPSGYKIRLRAAKRAENLPLDRAYGIYTFPEPIDLRNAVSVTRFSRFLAGLNVPLELLIVDTYAAATPGANENSAEDTTIAMLHAQRWRDELGATVVIVHHTNAGGTRERGHSAMRGAADFMISMTPVDDVVEVECSKQRNAAPFEKLTLKLVPAPDGQGCVFRLRDDVLPSPALTVSQRKAYERLKDGFSVDGATKTEWLKVCSDMPERTFYFVTKKLTELGYVTMVGTHYRLTERQPESLQWGSLQ
jgi:hypothetical protein